MSKKALAKQPAQQEPVAFLVDDDLYYPEEIDWETLQEQGHTVAALYTSPPAQRTWVGLTDEEIDKGLLRSDYAFKTAEAWRAGVVFAMTKLKEKNA